VHKG